MEQWEIDLRTKLEKELPEDMYNIGMPGFVCWTGKLGRINVEVEFIRACRTYKKEDFNNDKISE